MILFTATYNLQCKPASNNQPDENNTINKPAKTIKIQFILGSTRQGRISDKIATILKEMANKRQDVSTQLVDLRTFELPFLNDEISPSKRTEITDPAVKRWSEKIKEADAFIIVVPQYNAGYPGVLKNALDSLYAEWNHKPVAFVAYSGGPTGGTSVIAQLRQVVAELQMKPVALDIKIPTSWKAFDPQGNFVDNTIESKLNTVIDQLISSQENN